MTNIMQPRDNETYEEPEDEVQEVRVHAGFKKKSSRVLNNGTQVAKFHIFIFYIICKTFWTFKFQTPFFGCLIVGHFLAHFGQIS